MVLLAAQARAFRTLGVSGAGKERTQFAFQRVKFDQVENPPATTKEGFRAAS